MLAEEIINKPLHPLSRGRIRRHTLLAIGETSHGRVCIYIQLLNRRCGMRDEEALC